MPAATLFPDIEITWGRSGNRNHNPARNRQNPELSEPKAKNKGAISKASTQIAKGTGKAIRKTTFVWPIKFLLGILDTMAAPFGHMQGKDLNFPLLWKVGCGMILAAFWLYVAVDANTPRLLRDIGMTPGNVALLSGLARTIFPGMIGIMGACMIAGGIRLQQNKSFMAKFGAELEPLPAFESGVAFTIGDVKLSLRDMHTGIGAFGGIGSGKLSRWDSTTYVSFDGKSVRKKIGDLIVGERIQTPGNKTEKIIKLIDAEAPIWAVQTVCGKTHYCAPTHLWHARINGTVCLTETGSLGEELGKGALVEIPVSKENKTGWDNYHWIEAARIENTNKKEKCRCIVLTGTDHLYIVDGGIVTHNCLDPEQDVLMFDGTIKKVKAVQTGDLLMGPDGNARRIMSTSTGFGPLYKIIPIKGSGKPWICNDAHIMTLRYSSQGGSRPARNTAEGEVVKNHWSRVKHYKGIGQVFGEIPNKRIARYFQRVLEQHDFIMDVCIKDFIERKAPSRRLDLFWKLFRPAGIEFPDLKEHDPSHYSYTHMALNKEEFYLAGAWIGDGAIHSLGWYNQDLTVLDSIRAYAIEKGGRAHEYLPPKKDPRFRYLSIGRPDCKMTELEKWLLEFTNASQEQKTSCGGTLSGLYSRHGGQYDKDIPHWALIAPREKRLALLAGLLDTDGSLQQVGRCFDFTQKRKHIVEKTVWLCRSLGLAAAEPYESWKECTNRNQRLPTIEDLRAHPVLLQQLADRAILKLKLQQREGKIGQDEFDRLFRIFTRLGAFENADHHAKHDGYARFATIKRESGRYAVKASGLIETIKTLYFVRTGKNPRREIINKYVQSDEEFGALVAEVKEKCGLGKNQSDAEAWLEANEWEKLHIRVEGAAALVGDEPFPFDTEALHELVAFHESEPRERYWRTNISGNIGMIPTRVARKQVRSLRPEKRADGRGLPGIEDRSSKDPLCFGWDAEPIGDGPYCGFTLDGDGRFLLGDFTVTHNTVSMMVPLMRQFFRKLNDPDDNSEFARCGALILDEKGDFIDSTITEMLLAGRSLQDLVLIDPDLDLYRYNPLDPNQTADENAAKLAKVQKILGTSSGGDNAYWDQTSQVTIKFFLQLLEVYKPKHKIGLDDIARFMRDDVLASMLCDTVEKTIKEKRAKGEITEDAFGSYTDAISSTRNGWINLNQNTKSTLKTTITNMLGPIAQNPKLQKVFCRDTNFSFRDLPNLGKIVLFRGSGVDKATARLICVCLKIDFQTWQKRRNGSSAAAYGLNTARTVVFICDEYQEFVTCGGEGDETFYGVSRSTRTAPIVATQSYNSLETAIKNKEQTKTLRQNIATWVFFRTTDQDTCELGKFLAGQSKKEDFSTSVNTDGLVSSAANLAAGGGGKQNSVNVSRKLEENFRVDAFSRLVTMTMEKSRTGPWYSEAIVYHYHDIDEEAESRCYKTKLSHLYYDNKLRKTAGLNVKHLDWVLWDRNWQRKVLQRGLFMIQTATEETNEIKKLDMMRRGSKAALEAERKKIEDSPELSAERKRVAELVDKTRQENAEAAKNLSAGGLSGEIDTEEEVADKAEAQARLAKLEEELMGTDSEEEMSRIKIRIDHEKKILSRLVITESSRAATPQKQVLRANALPGEDPDDPREPDTGMLMVENDQEEDDPSDDLWDESVPVDPDITAEMDNEEAVTASMAAILKTPQATQGPDIAPIAAKTLQPDPEGAPEEPEIPGGETFGKPETTGETQESAPITEGNENEIAEEGAGSDDPPDIFGWGPETEPDGQENDGKA